MDYNHETMTHFIVKFPTYMYIIQATGYMQYGNLVLSLSGNIYLNHLPFCICR